VPSVGVTVPGCLALGKVVMVPKPRRRWGAALATHGWVSLRTARRQHGSSTQKDPRPPPCIRRLLDASGGLVLFRRTCRTPMHGPLRRLCFARCLPSPSTVRASNSGSVDTGGGGSRPCSPGSSGPSESSSASSPCGTGARSSSGGSLPSASPTNLPRPGRALPLTTAVATATAGAPTTHCVLQACLQHGTLRQP